MTKKEYRDSFDFTNGLQRQSVRFRRFWLSSNTLSHLNPPVRTSSVASLVLTAYFLSSIARADSAVEQSWRNWDMLPDSEKVNIAPYCPGGFVVIPLQQMPEQKTRFLFDNAQRTSDTQTEFSGNVHIVGDQLNADSDYAVYINGEETARLAGDVSVLLPEALISGESAIVKPNNDYALMNNAQFVFADRDIHGTADELERQNKKIFVARDMEFTRCTPGTSQWSMSSSKLRVDNEQQIASAWHSTLNVKGIPVMYVPYVSFPLNDQPKTGFLTPTLGSGLTVPYYINLAPNYDDTVALNYTNDLGYTGQNEFRFLTKAHSGTNSIAYQLTDVEEGDIRRWSIDHHQSGTLAGIGYNLSTAWFSDTNANIAFNPGTSDEVKYQNTSLKLNKKLGAFNNSLSLQYLQPVVDSVEKFESLTTTASTSYDNTSLSLVTKIQDEYQNPDRPEGSKAALGDYKYLPQPAITLAHKKTPWPLGITGTEQLQYGHFQKDLSREIVVTQLNDDKGTEAQNNANRNNQYHATIVDRYHVQAVLSRPFKGKSWSITPTWTGLATRYQLDNEFDNFSAFENSKEIDQLAWRANIDTRATITLPIDSNDKYLVKPRLYYSYAPLFKDQHSPVVEGDFVNSFVLFTDSRFSGIDRVADMSRLSGSLGYEWHHNDQAVVTINASKGIKLAQERLMKTATGSIVAEPEDDWTTEYSDWNGSAKLQFTDALSLTGNVSYDHKWQQANTYSAVLSYQPGDGRVLTLSGVKADTKDTDSEENDIDGFSHEFMAGAYLPVYKNIALMSYVNFYDFAKDSEVNQPDYEFRKEDLQLEQALVGIDFDACCWNLRLAMLSVNADAFDQNTDALFPVNTKQTYYFEFTLKGLGGGIGSIENILNRLDFGYSGKIFNYQ